MNSPSESLNPKTEKTPPKYRKEKALRKRKKYFSRFFCCSLKEILIVLYILIFMNKLVGNKDCYEITRDINLASNLSIDKYVAYMSNTFKRIEKKPFNLYRVALLYIGKITLSGFTDPESLSYYAGGPNIVTNFNEFMKVSNEELMLRFITDSSISDFYSRNFYLPVRKTEKNDNTIEYKLVPAFPFYQIFIEDFPKEHLYTRRFTKFSILFKLVKNADPKYPNRPVRSKDRLKDLQIIPSYALNRDPNLFLSGLSDYNYTLKYNEELDGHLLTIDPFKSSLSESLYLLTSIAEYLLNKQIIEKIDLTVSFYNINYKKFLTLSADYTIGRDDMGITSQKSYCYELSESKFPNSVIMFFLIIQILFFIIDLIIYCYTLSKFGYFKHIKEKNNTFNPTVSELNSPESKFQSFAFQKTKTVFGQQTSLKKIEKHIKSKKSDADLKLKNLIRFIMPLMGIFQFIFIILFCYGFIQRFAKAEEIKNLNYQKRESQDNPIINKKFLEYAKINRRIKDLYFYCLVSSLIRFIALSRYSIGFFDKLLQTWRRMISILSKNWSYILFYAWINLLISFYLYVGLGTNIQELNNWPYCLKLVLLASLLNWRWILIIKEKHEITAAVLGFSYYMFMGLLFLNMLKMKMISFVLKKHQVNEIHKNIKKQTRIHPWNKFKIFFNISNLKKKLNEEKKIELTSDDENSEEEEEKKKKSINGLNIQENTPFWDKNIEDYDYRSLTKIENLKIPKPTFLKELKRNIFVLLGSLLLLYLNVEFLDLQRLSLKSNNLSLMLQDRYLIIRDTNALIETFTKIIPPWISIENYEKYQTDTNKKKYISFSRGMKMESDIFIFPTYYKTEENKDEFKEYFTKKISSKELITKFPEDLNYKVKRDFAIYYTPNELSNLVPRPLTPLLLKNPNIENPTNNLNYSPSTENSKEAFLHFPRIEGSPPVAEIYKMVLDGVINSDLATISLEFLYRFKGSDGLNHYKITFERQLGNSFKLRVSNFMIGKVNTKTIVLEILILILIILYKIFQVLTFYQRYSIRAKIYNIWYSFEILPTSKLGEKDRLEREKRKPEIIRKYQYYRVGRLLKEIIHFIVLVFIIISLLLLISSKKQLNNLLEKKDHGNIHKAISKALEMDWIYFLLTIINFVLCVYDFVLATSHSKKLKRIKTFMGIFIKGLVKFFVPMFLLVVLIGSTINMYYNIEEVANSKTIEFWEPFRLIFAIGTYFETTYEKSELNLSILFILMLLIIKIGIFVMAVSYFKIEIKEILKLYDKDLEKRVEQKTKYHEDEKDYFENVGGYIKSLSNVIPDADVRFFIFVNEF